MQTQAFNESDRIYRIDKFIVPNQARNDTESGGIITYGFSKN